ncbi:hypothetical protein DYB32_010098 [Aphanomyces invadans]|uniref:Uncharacterized protein n=1 Tax=Aphanomyces invadans TaxID=157072 RepID=A0A418AGQ2_9STRA|nr:hypothetical protein DYB32_010098 [Aphanomyces invadans]
MLTKRYFILRLEEKHMTLGYYTSKEDLVLCSETAIALYDTSVEEHCRLERIVEIESEQDFVGRTRCAQRQHCGALERNLNLVQDVWREYQASQTVTAAIPSGNRTTHFTKVPRTKLVIQMVQQFVRGRRSTRTRTTAVDVMMYLKEMYALDFDVEDKKQYAASYRAVQRFLKAQGYKRGSRKGTSTYHLSTANALARDTYVKLMHPHSTTPTRSNVVYSDESYFHHHYKSHHQDLFDPSDDHDVQSKEKHKGRRYCFVAGILNSPTSVSKVMALDIFTGGKPRAKEPQDYHGMFDHAYYVKWFGRNGRKWGYQRSYHSRQREVPQVPAQINTNEWTSQKSLVGRMSTVWDFDHGQ